MKKKSPGQKKHTVKKEVKKRTKKGDHATKHATEKKSHNQGKKAVPQTVAKASIAKRPPGMPEKLRDAALRVLDERQADDIVTVDVGARSSVADYVIIASGRASRQLGAIAHYLRVEFDKLGIKQTRIEGVSEGNWVLIDGGDVIVHLFRPEVRRYYDLESIWDGSARATVPRDD